MKIETPFTQQVGIDVPLICGAMYPCSNPELVAAASEAGAIGIVQPISMQFVHGHELRRGLQIIRRLTDRPVGFNALVEKTVQAFEDQMRRWVDIALEEGVRFFVSALGNPRWVVEQVHAAGGIVYHDVTNRGHALKAAEHDVDGFICVNNRAGGHAGDRSAEQLLQELADLGKPLVCAGGVGSAREFKAALEAGYSAVQMGTRFIATPECSAHIDYKLAILDARESDIALTDKLSGIPCSVIRTPTVEKLGLRAGPVERFLLQQERTKRWVRSYYSLTSAWKLKKANLRGLSYQDFWQAGKSVATIDRIKPVRDVVREFAEALG